MASFAELVTASSNATLVEKIKIATLVAADKIRLEASSVPDHQSRMRWALRVFSAADAETTKMIWPVLVQNRTFTASQIAGADDASVQAAVDAAVNLMASGG